MRLADYNRRHQIEQAAAWIAESQHLVAFTGAGIDGDTVRPGAAHHALVELERMGKVALLISQNVSGLHVRSGFPQDKLAELHGNSDLMRCLACDHRLSYEQAGWPKKRWGEGYRTETVRPGQPRCPKCRGRLISSVVNFGDPLPAHEIGLAFRHSAKTDLFFAIGSSLVVAPANNMPLAALEAGAPLILLNRGETPFDELATLRMEGDADELLVAIVDRVNELLARQERAGRRRGFPYV